MPDFTLSELREVTDSALGVEEATALTEDALDVSFTDLGYDSLAVFELATLLQERLSIRISDEETERLSTPRAVLDFVNGKLKAGT